MRIQKCSFPFLFWFVEDYLCCCMALDLKLNVFKTFQHFEHENFYNFQRHLLGIQIFIKLSNLNVKSNPTFRVFIRF